MLGWVAFDLDMDSYSLIPASLHGAVVLVFIQIKSQVIIDYTGLKWGESWNLETCKLKGKYFWHHKPF